MRLRFRRSELKFLLVALSILAADQDAQLSPEFEKQLVELGAMVMTAGACSRHMSTDQIKEFHGVINGEKINLHPDDEWFRPVLVDLLRDTYLQGMRSEEANTVTVEMCRNLLNDYIAEISSWKKR